MKHMLNNVIKVFAFWMLGALWIVSADDSVWKGEDGAYLNDAANWEGTAPFSGTSSNNMKFKNSPSNAYTVKLSDDLVSAGSWSFNDMPVTLTWDLGGHSLTFLANYNDHSHQGWTNIIENGTIAFTNAAGTIQTVNFWHAKSGNALFLREGASFIGNFSFSDGGTKTLDVRDGAQWRGRMGAYGYRCSATFTGAGTVADLANGEFSLGGAANNENQAGEVTGYIADGAVVTNAGGLLVGGTVGGKCHLVISNATFALAPSNASSMAVIGGGGLTYVWGKDANGNSVQIATNDNATCENTLSIVDGSVVDFANNRFSVGNSGWKMRTGGLGSHSNLVYVAGEGTVVTALLANADWPGVIGHNGSWNQLHLTDGAYMRTGFLSAGGQCKQWGNNVATSCWNRVTVDKGAHLDSNATLLLGTRHVDDFKNGRAAIALNASNVYEVVNGGKVTASGIEVGRLYCAKDNRFIVDGEGSQLDLISNRYIYIGSSGSPGNGFEVTGGAALTGVKYMKIGEEVYYQGDEQAVGCTASNNYARIEGTTVEDIYTIEVGAYYNGGNTLWVGDGATVKAGGVIFRGFGQRLVVSNGLLRVALDNQTYQHGLRPAWTETDYTADYSGKHTFEFGKHTFEFYEQGRIVNGKNMGCDFTNACKFVFHVPAKGYTEAPLESQSAGLQFSDDSEFTFDFDAVSKDGLRNIPLLKYSGDMGEQYRIVMSDDLLEKINAAAAKVREGSKVRLSSDRRELTLRVGSAGLAIIVR